MRAATAASVAGASASLAGMALALAWGSGSRALAQNVDVQRPKTLVVGMPAGGARMDRLDGARTGWTRETLPTTGLRSEWRSSLGEPIEHAPLVDAAGVTYVVGVHGAVSAVGRDGAERWRAATGAMQPGPAALLSDDTLVFVDVAGEAVALRTGAVRWRLRFGRSDAARPAPLPLLDGGVVVATTQDLALLDAEGHMRARVTLPEPTTSPLVAARGKIVAVTASGTVWAWTPGAPEAARVASFGTAIADGAALADEHTLVAVSGGQTQLLAVDLDHPAATAQARAVAPAGLLLGPPAMLRSAAYLLMTTPTADLAVAFDGSGAELFRTALVMHPPPVAPDGGPGVLVAPPRAAPLVDGSGAIAFATADGAVGVATTAGSEVVADTCPVVAAMAGRVPAIPAVVGLAPLAGGPTGGPPGPTGLVAACASGSLVALRAVGAKR
jgi:hypothetical protein